MSIMTLAQTDQVFISKRFQRVVVLHMLKNMLKQVEVQIPLLLGIYGPSGEGKTVQVEHILKTMGVNDFCSQAARWTDRLKAYLPDWFAQHISKPAKPFEAAHAAWQSY